jgi:carbonic anhydrase
VKSRDERIELSRRGFALGGFAMTAVLAARGAAIAADPGAIKQAGPAAAEMLEDLMAGNRRFMDGRPRTRALTARRSALAVGQQPHVVMLTCSDSRLSPELIFDRDLGDLFVVRVAGNVADAIALGSMEYAVDHFPVTVLVVLGHEKCGAVAAAASGEKAPTPNIEALLKKIEPALTPLRRRAAGEELVRLGVEANVHQSVRDILDQSPLLRRAAESGKVMLVKALYRLASGEVVRLGSLSSGER